MMATLYFKPVTMDKKPLICQWLQQDYIKEWIHGEGLGNVLKGLDKFIEQQPWHPVLHHIMRLDVKELS